MNIAHRIITLAALAACSSSADKDAPGTPHAAPAKSMDSRTPLPLTEMMATHQKQEMRDHLRVVQEITTALVTDDFDAIAKSAARIGWSDQQAKMCKHMGAGAPGFAEVGEHFHKTADTIAEAAKRRDRAGVTAGLSTTLQTCIGCHDTYRQELVDGPTFDAFAGSESGMDCSMMHSN